MKNELQIIERENQRVLTTAQISEEYGTDNQVITNNFNRNKERYVEGKHYYALKSDSKREFLNLTQIDLGSAKNSKSLYLWTEKGALLHAKSLGTDKAWEVYDYLVESYFNKKEQLQNIISKEDLALISIAKANSPEERMLAVNTYTNLIKQPLLETIQKQAPKVKLAEIRIDQKGCYSLTDVTKSLGLKRGQITKWAKDNGYIHKTISEVNKLGEKYFKVYSSDGIHNQIGITDEGLNMVKEIFS